MYLQPADACAESSGDTAVGEEGKSFWGSGGREQPEEPFLSDTGLDLSLYTGTFLSGIFPNDRSVSVFSVSGSFGAGKP